MASSNCFKLIMYLVMIGIIDFDEDVIQKRDIKKLFDKQRAM